MLPQILAAIDLPVIAAGGIVDGKGIANALALGASGVQMGTAFPAAMRRRPRRCIVRRFTHLEASIRR